MKFSPRLPEGNVNVSKTPPLVETAWILGGLITLLIILYFFLGLLVGWAARHLPVDAELWIGSHVSERLVGDKSPPLQKRLDALVAALPQDSPLHSYPLTIYLDESNGVNAFALPGGSIVVLRGLLDTVETENELSMILAHELGHFAHRDHLKAMGRGLLVAAVAWSLSGNQKSTSELITGLATNIEAKYSQKQEEAADSFGLQLLNNRYGHTGGATAFFDRLAGQVSSSRFAFFLASHPHPGDRVKNIKKLILTNSYTVKETSQLAQDILSLTK